MKNYKLVEKQNSENIIKNSLFTQLTEITLKRLRVVTASVGVN